MLKSAFLADLLAALVGLNLILSTASWPQGLSLVLAVGDSAPGRPPGDDVQAILSTGLNQEGNVLVFGTAGPSRFDTNATI